MSSEKQMVYPDVTIIIPALNEEKALGKVLESLKSSFPEIPVIVINDGSTDATEKIATDAGARVITHEFCRGYGASLRTGTKAADTDFVLFCDGDAQHTAKDVGRIMAECDGYDMVVGARTAESDQPLLRRPGKFVLKIFANFVAGTRIPDLNSGLRVFRRETLLKYLHLMPTGFSFSSTSTFAILKSNRRHKYIPITVEKRIGKSTVSQFKHGIQTLLLIVRLAVLFEPLKVFFSVAGVFFVLSMASLGIDIFCGDGLADTTVLLSVTTIVIFMSGLLCDQVSALRREKHE